MTPKTPTASGISRLLSSAGHTRADIDWGHAGFKAEKCRTREDAVKVYAYFPVSDAPDSQYRVRLRRYANAIEAAGYGTEVYDYHLIVLAAKEG